MNTYFKRVVVGSLSVMQLFANMQAIVVSFEGKEPEYFANTKTWHEVSETIRHQTNMTEGAFHISIKFADEELLVVNDNTSPWWNLSISECLSSDLLKAYKASDLTINAFIQKEVAIKLPPRPAACFAPMPKGFPGGQKAYEEYIKHANVLSTHKTK